jgi:hypothetical protein
MAGYAKGNSKSSIPAVRTAKAGYGISKAAAIILFLVFGCNSYLLLGQNCVSGRIKGFVRNLADRSPIANAVVEVRNKTTGARWSTLSFANGSFTFPLLSSGEYTIYCRKEGYENDQYGPIYVSLVRTTTINIPPFLLRPVSKTKSSTRIEPQFELRSVGGYRRNLMPASFAPIQPVLYPLVDESAKLPSVSPVPAQRPPVLNADPQAVQLVNTENPLRSGNFNERFLTSLPLPGIRTFDSLAFLVAGVEEPPQAVSESSGPGIGAGVGTPGQFSVNGMRARANSFTIDGSDNNDPDVAVRRQGFLSQLPQSVESIQEFQISTLLWDSELGRNLGSQVNAVSRSGANEFHGQAYGFLTDSRMNARNFFDYTGGASGGKDPFTRTQAGLSLGGPVVQDRTQLFGNFEMQSIHASREQHFASPSADERRFLGLPRFKVITSSASVNNHFDYETSGATPLGLNLLSLYPSPNQISGPFGGNTFSQTQPASGQAYVLSLKLAHQIAAGHTLNGRYSFADDGRDLPSIGNAINSAIRSQSRIQNVSLILDSGLSGTLFNQARISFGRTRLEFGELPNNSLSLAKVNQTLPGQIAAFTKSGVAIPGSVTAYSSTGPVGELIIRPFSPVGLDTSLFPQERVNNTFQFADTVLKTWLGHTVKFGADIRFVQFNSRQDRNYRTRIEVNNGRLETRGSADSSASGVQFLPGIQFADIGQVSSIFRTITKSVPDSYIGLRFGEYNFFVNESWRARSNLNFDLGLRYEFNTVPREVNNRIENAIGLQNIPVSGMSAFDSPQATDAFNRAVNSYSVILDGRSRMYDSDWNNFSPHLGFAWDPLNNGKMSVRGGYGLYYDTILGAVVSQSRNVFPNEIPFLSESSFFGHDGLNANNPSFFALSNSNGDVLPFFIGDTNQIAGGEADFVALVGTLFNSVQEAGGLSFTLPARKLRTPYVQQWHLTVEREIFHDYFLAASYVGTSGTKLTRLTTPNGGSSVTPAQVLIRNSGATPTVSFDVESGVVNQFPIQRRNRDLGAYRVYENSAGSRYHALQIEAGKRFTRGFVFTGAYTWSHALDDVSDTIDSAGASSIAQDSHNLRAEWGNADFDVRHRLSISAIVDLPRFQNKLGRLLAGWQVASIFQARTGQPFTLAVPFDANLDGNLTDRPSTTSGLVFMDGHGPQRVEVAPGWVVTDFFVLNRNGVVGRNTLRGDGLISWDFALNRRFRFSDAQSLDARFEVFNVLNRANFGLPVRTIGNPGFGSSTNTITPARIIQLALKFKF